MIRRASLATVVLALACPAHADEPEAHPFKLTVGHYRYDDSTDGLDVNLRHEGISDRELMVALRQNQLLSPDEALYVFLETNGQISVIPRRDGDEADGGAPDLNADTLDPDREASHPRGGSPSGTFRRRFRRQA